MRIIPIENEDIKALLEEKEEIVKKARVINEEIDKKARVINDAEFEKLGVKIDGDVYSGSFETLKKAFNLETTNVIDTLIKSEIGDKFEEIESLETRRQAILEKVSDIIDREVLPTEDLAEFEEPTDIRIENGKIELTIEDKLASFQYSQAEKLEAFKAKFKADRVK